jgi:hypothetical protein
LSTGSAGLGEASATAVLFEAVLEAVPAELGPARLDLVLDFVEGAALSSLPGGDGATPSLGCSDDGFGDGLGDGDTVGVLVDSSGGADVVLTAGALVGLGVTGGGFGTWAFSSRAATVVRLVCTCVISWGRAGALALGVGVGFGLTTALTSCSARSGSGRIALELTGPPARLTQISPP